ncbi:helix-turn-helix domain-containing protein [Amorphoplanes nipponensis]|uniref:AraC family transcriptional regulator n=1 Tax=Actinoplanes nipponensis TaxID=135950 RepID=A0A919JCP3_9ACTN|nr:helix-turn-helix domain-containing protein [Actinoplanes nipponensis]GIE47162.1 AraC family transcriptional regulator [Actinoplanes nipponensis]
MRPAVDQCADAAVWDVARPARPSRVAGVSLAGFRDRGLSTAGHRAIPHPAVTMALDFGADPLIVDDAAGRQRRGSLVAGLGFGPGAVRVRGESFQAVQVRLSPVIAGAVLGVSPADLDGAVVALDDLWGRRASHIREQLADASSWEERFAVTDAMLARRSRAGWPVDREVAWAWKRILAGRGRVRIDVLAAEVGWSRKRLWSRFHAQIGLPPKRAAKLVRFDHAAHRLAAGEDAARVAADGGYADQSHLHRDVVAFTRATPATVAGEPWLAVDDIAWPDRRAAPR